MILNLVKYNYLLKSSHSDKLVALLGRIAVLINVFECTLILSHKNRRLLLVELDIVVVWFCNLGLLILLFGRGFSGNLLILNLLL